MSIICFECSFISNVLWCDSDYQKTFSGLISFLSVLLAAVEIKKNEGVEH